MLRAIFHLPLRIHSLPSFSLFYIPGSWSVRTTSKGSLSLWLPFEFSRERHLAADWREQGEWACPCQATCLPQPKNPASVRQSSPHHTLSLRVPELSSLSSFLQVKGQQHSLLITAREYCLWFPYTLSTPSQWVVIWKSSPTTQLKDGILSCRNLDWYKI